MTVLGGLAIGGVACVGVFTIRCAFIRWWKPLEKYPRPEHEDWFV